MMTAWAGIGGMARIFSLVGHKKPWWGLGGGLQIE